MNPIYYFEDVPTASWGNLPWQVRQVGVRALLRYWYVGNVAINANTVRVFYFSLPLGAVNTPNPNNGGAPPSPTPIPNPLPAPPGLAGLLAQHP